MAALLLLASLAPSASAQSAPPLDEAAIRQRIYGGRFDELKELEAAGNKGDAVAMLWWGSLLGGCVYGPCDSLGERAWTRKAALVGHAQARVIAMRSAASAADLEALISEIGPPRNALERSAYVLMLATFNVPGAVEQLAQLNREALADGTLFPLLVKTSLEGSKNQEPLLRALVEAGTDRALEMLVRHQVLYAGLEREQIMDKALAGDRLLAVAQCGTLRARTGELVLPEKLLPLCEQAAQAGYPAALNALIAHHMAGKNLRAARYYADLCEKQYAAYCADNAADLYQTLVAAGPTPELVVMLDYWNTVAGEVGPGTTQRPLQLTRRIYATRVRHAAMLRACNASKYVQAETRFDLDAECPWRKKVQIAPEYLSTR